MHYKLISFAALTLTLFVFYELTGYIHDNGFIAFILGVGMIAVGLAWLTYLVMILWKVIEGFLED